MGMSAEDAVRKFFESYNAHDVDAVGEVLAEDFAYNDVGMGIEHQGKQEALAYFAQLFQAPDLRWEVRSMFSSGNRVAVESTWSCTIPPGVGRNTTDAPMQAGGDAATIIHTADGLLVSLTDYHNPGS